jgi:CRP-like cAMP-binding protein
MDAGRVVALPSGPVYTEAESPARIAIVLSGTVVATWESPDGRTMFAGVYGPGQFMGAATLAGGPTTVGIQALTPNRLLEWRSADFRAIAALDIAFLADLLTRTVFAIQALNHLIKVRVFTTARARLAALLLEHEQLVFSRRPMLPMSQLAALAGVTPRMVSRIIHDWEGEKVLRRSGQVGLVLLDRARLIAEAAPLDLIEAPDPSSPGAWSSPAWSGRSGAIEP